MLRDKVQLIEYLLAEKGIFLPASIYNTEVIKNLERKIKIKSPAAVSDYLKWIGENIDKVIEANEIKKIIEIIDEVTKEGKKNNSKCERFFLKLSQEDKNLAHFIANRPLNILENLRIMGIYYYLIQVLDNIFSLRYKKQNKNLVVSSLMWIYLNMYELLLHEIDRRIYSDNNLMKKLEEKNKEVYKEFKKVKRDRGQHAMKWQLVRILKELDIVSEGSHSLLSGESKLRNAIAHANVLYDETRDLLISLGKEKWSVCCLIREIVYLVAFFRMVFTEAIGSSEDINIIEGKLKDNFLELSKMFRLIERSGNLKIAYIKVITNFIKGAKIVISQKESTENKPMCP